jgi:hypothetical protein
MLYFLGFGIAGVSWRISHLCISLRSTHQAEGGWAQPRLFGAVEIL